MAEKLKLGIIGCGMISDIYLKNIADMFGDRLQAVACADIVEEKVRACARKYGIRAESVDELLADGEVEALLNLTIPSSHASVSLRAIRAGKHVYSEKPLATKFSEAEELVGEAEARGLYIGCAPDTFLGGGYQTVRALLDEGAAGTPVLANAFLLSKGPESFHPNPAFFYKEGAGPLFDMGPYYITALVALFGPVKSVAAVAKSAGPYRYKPSGEKFPSETATHVSAVLNFESGLVANLTTSWDMNFSYWQSGLPLVEIFGSAGAIICPDPNTFCGITALPMKETGHGVQVRQGGGEFVSVPLRDERYIANSRGLGLYKMAVAIREGGAHPASGRLALHVLEVMCAALRSQEEGRTIELKTRCERPQTL